VLPPLPARGGEAEAGEPGEPGENRWPSPTSRWDVGVYGSRVAEERPPAGRLGCIVDVWPETVTTE